MSEGGGKRGGGVRDTKGDRDGEQESKREKW